METDDAVVGRIVNRMNIVGEGVIFNRAWLHFISDCFSDVPASQLQRVFKKLYIEQPQLREPLEIRYGEQAAPVNVIAAVEETDDNNNNNPDLDGDAVEEILRRLPLPSLMRAKSVCKEWNRVISAPNFKVIPAPAPDFKMRNGEHFVTQQSSNGIVFFSVSLNQWFPMRLPAWNENENENEIGLFLCAAADGLLLILHECDGLGRPVIFNLLTKQQTLLACPETRLQRTAVELIVRAGHFQIIAIDIDDKIQVYESRKKVWRRIQASIPARNVLSPRDITTHWWNSTLSVENGMVYFTNSFGRRLGCYNIARRGFKYKEIAGGMPAQIDYHDNGNNFRSTLPSLLACNGKLLLVGRLLKDAKVWGRFPFIEHTLVGIWELDSTHTWSLISTTPPHLLEDTVKSSHGTDFTVAASSDKIWFTIKGSMNMLTFNLSSMEWSVLPGYTVGDGDLVEYIPRRTFYFTMAQS